MHIELCLYQYRRCLHLRLHRHWRFASYEFDCLTCINIDECDSAEIIVAECGEGTCVDSTGGFSCTCNEGYVESGTYPSARYTNINECDSWPLRLQPAAMESALIMMEDSLVFVILDMNSPEFIHLQHVPTWTSVLLILTSVALTCSEVPIHQRTAPI